jgi:hypothetical protein
MIEKKVITENDIINGFGACEICGCPFDSGDTVYIVDDYNAVACCKNHAVELEL